MHGQHKVSSAAGYLARLKEPRRGEIAALDELIRKTAPKLTPFILNGMLAYGPYHYKYASGREGDWARIALASNKSYISLYICSLGYISEQYKVALPKANIGKGCIRFKRLSDVDLPTLKKLIRETAQDAAKA